MQQTINLESLGTLERERESYTLENKGAAQFCNLIYKFYEIKENIIKNERENYSQLLFDINSKYNSLFFRVSIQDFFRKPKEFEVFGYKYYSLKKHCSLVKYQNLSKEVA